MGEKPETSGRDVKCIAGCRNPYNNNSRNDSLVPLHSDDPSPAAVTFPVHLSSEITDPLLRGSLSPFVVNFM